jgi:hypothetical protein
MNAFPWLRLYNETLSDRKIARVCRDTGQPKALVIGVWATLLMLASESPRRGELLISDDLPLSPDEIRDETGLDATAFDAIIAGLASYALIDTSGDAWAICNWEKRQPPSDNSAERVRQHRQRQRTVTPPPSSNGGTPLQKRNSNALDREEDKDRDKEGEKSGAIAPPTPPPAFQPVPEEVQKQKRRRGIQEPEPAIVSTAPAAVRLLAQLTGYYPGDDVAPALVAEFGETPDEDALRKAVEFWRLSTYKLTNWLGIAEWYKEIRRRPDWTPQDRFKGNGKATQPTAAPVTLKPIAPGLY